MLRALASKAGSNSSSLLLRSASSRSSSALFPSSIAIASYHSRLGCYGFRIPPKPTPEEESNSVIENRIDNPNLLRLVSAFRGHGHKSADIDPLGLAEKKLAFELDPKVYGLDLSSTEKFKLLGVVDLAEDKKGKVADFATLKSIYKHLQNIYCGHIGVEFEHLPDSVERRWWAENMERRSRTPLSSEEKKALMRQLSYSEVFDSFMSKRFGQVKRYGGEGAESMIVGVDEIFKAASEYKVWDIVLGMPHRGRLNLLTDTLKFAPAKLFHKIKGNAEFPAEFNNYCIGDVISHLHGSFDLHYHKAAKPVHVSMIPNPSHLEACNPVALGKTRAKQLYLQDGDYKEDRECKLGDRVMCFQLHGDAAFSAQGVVTESLGMANLPHYTVGGTVHMIVNNQLGFTTPSDRGRSTRYCSDVGKMIDAPIIHVNGDYPEEVVHACRLAMDYRMRFRKDVIIDLLCYRRMGHNELDDPSMTQPVMYRSISTHKSVPKLYEEQLIAEKIVSAKEIEELRQKRWDFLDQQLTAASSFSPSADEFFRGKWAKMSVPSDREVTKHDTGVDMDTLLYVGRRSVAYPESLNIHPRLRKVHVEARLKRLETPNAIDWATAEAMAFGTLMLEKHHVRISGQDVGRGTFSQRHSMLVDQNDDSAHVPLNDLQRPQGFIEIANSDLSEFGVLGYEYGVSIENPNTLTVWEAQFGDFFNGAQIIIDTYIGSGEAKWLKQSGLVMLLPHGYDGAGPEHSSCRMERFLQLTDSDIFKVDTDRVNMGVVNPTTPAQYFHLIRRQMKRPFRKPLVVVGPKTLLRLAACTSDLKEMQSGTTFLPVLADPKADAGSVTRVMFVSGKLYYDLDKVRTDNGDTSTAIVRVEELCPFPTFDIKAVIDQYTNALEYVWIQEEQQNMGAYSFVAPRFEAQLGIKIKYIGRGPLAAPAVGVSSIHKKEVAELMNAAFP